MRISEPMVNVFERLLAGERAATASYLRVMGDPAAADVKDTIEKLMVGHARARSHLWAHLRSFEPEPAESAAETDLGAETPLRVPPQDLVSLLHTLRSDEAAWSGVYESLKPEPHFSTEDRALLFDDLLAHQRAHTEALDRLLGLR
jgi:hypothetical protein